MEDVQYFINKLQSYGTGRRKLDDILFINDKPPPRLGVYDFDEENYCHEVVQSQCNVPGCLYTAETILEFENHYDSAHRYSCAQCKKVFYSPHFLDLHIQECHDSFFAVLAERRPSYGCYIEECKEKFNTTEERNAHCIEKHKLPKAFRFDTKPKNKNKKKANASKPTDEAAMELDTASTSESKPKFFFNNSKLKTFAKYTGRKFTKSEVKKEKENSKDVNMDAVMTELKESLPE